MTNSTSPSARLQQAVLAQPSQHENLLAAVFSVTPTLQRPYYADKAGKFEQAWTQWESHGKTLPPAERITWAADFVEVVVNRIVNKIQSLMDEGFDPKSIDDILNNDAGLERMSATDIMDNVQSFTGVNISAAVRDDPLKAMMGISKIIDLQRPFFDKNLRGGIGVSYALGESMTFVDHIDKLEPVIAVRLFEPVLKLIEEEPTSDDDLRIRARLSAQRLIETLSQDSTAGLRAVVARSWRSNFVSGPE